MPEPTTPNPTPDASAPLPREVLATIAAVVGEVLATLPRAEAAEPSELLTPEQAAAFLAIGRTSLADLDARGFVPEPRRLGDGGRLLRWSRSELVEWVRAGCPNRQRWSVMKTSQTRRAG